jgi:hypothetical protein
MADYRDLAAALGGGYGQDTGPITPDTLLTLKNGKTASAGDLLGLLKGYGQAIGSNLESLGRGGVASVIGAGGDLESLGRMGINKLYGAGGVNVNPTPVLPTTTDILGMMPRATAPRQETAGMEELGGFMTPATAKVLKPAATSVARMAGQEINAGLTGQPTRSLLGTITPQPAQIVPTDVAKRIDMPVNLPTSKEFFKAVENDPSAQITNEGLLINLKRSQNPQQSGLESVRTGVFYLPENQASNLKHYRGKTNYGGSEPIEGQTLYKNPLFVKGATGGKAPEMAYVQLTDKAQLKELQNDVFKAIHGPKDIKVDLVQQFLEKHAPDLTDYAHYIIDNSKQGNQLKYALQEAAVAHKVREAGHDAVLGYGKGRGDKGEFFSEVFDVRESHYPTPQGDYELMPQFENKIK